MGNREGVVYNKEKFFALMKLVHECQVGNTYYFLRNSEIIKGTVYEVNFRVYDHGLTHTSKNELTLELNIIMLFGGSSTQKVEPHKLFNTREEAAEDFLKLNNVPSELLRVLKKEEPKTTVSDLIAKLQTVSPQTDLGEDFWNIAKTVQGRYMKELEFTDEYWDCECETRYIHPTGSNLCSVCGAARINCPDSKVSELKPENMFYGNTI
jgi:hypothetical protein